MTILIGKIHLKKVYTHSIRVRKIDKKHSRCSAGDQGRAGAAAAGVDDIQIFHTNSASR